LSHSYTSLLNCLLDHALTVVGPRPNITLNHNPSADNSESDEEDVVEYTVRHGGHGEYYDDEEDELEESEEEEDDALEEDSQDSWDHLRDYIPGEEDIDPSESASRSQQPTAQSARGYAAGKQPVGRGTAPRTFPKVPEPPQGSPPRQARARTRERPRRPRSVTNVDAMEDDYPRGGYGHPGQLPYHPAPQWSGVNLYPGAPSAVSGGGYNDNSFALSQYSRGDPFSYGQQPGNPFTQPPDEYSFSTRRNRSSMPPGAGGEMMRYGAYPPPGYPPYGGYPPPGYPPFQGYPGYPGAPHQTPSPNASKKGTPAPDGGADGGKEDPEVKAIKQLLLAQEKRDKDKAAAKILAAAESKKAAEEVARKKEEDKLEALQKLIIEHNKQQLEREKKQLERMEKDLKAKEALEEKAAAQKKANEEKNKELKAAAEKAKLDAEKEAAKKAAEEKEKHDKEIEEAKKKAAELEAGKKKAEEEAAKLRPTDDMLKSPIKFKDAVGRKFSFPWHLCKTWKVRIST
jgi:hypothetical protein